MLRNLFRRFFQNLEPAAQLRLHATPLLLAHAIEFFDGMLQTGEHCGFKGSIDRRGFTQRARHTEDDVQIRLAGCGKLGRSFAKRGDIAGNQLAIELKPLVPPPFQAQGDLNVPAPQAFFEDAANLHLQFVHVRRQAELRVEEPMVNGLEGKRECRPITCLGLHLCESGHGAYGHAFVQHSSSKCHSDVKRGICSAFLTVKKSSRSRSLTLSLRYKVRDDTSITILDSRSRNWTKDSLITDLGFGSDACFLTHFRL